MKKKRFSDIFSEYDHYIKYRDYLIDLKDKVEMSFDIISVVFALFMFSFSIFNEGGELARLLSGMVIVLVLMSQVFSCLVVANFIKKIDHDCDDVGDGYGGVFFVARVLIVGLLLVSLISFY